MYDTNLKRKWDNQAALEYARHEGMEKGMEKGLEKGIEKGMEKGKAEVVYNLITKLGLTNEQAADIAEVTVAFVKKIRGSSKKK